MSYWDVEYGPFHPSECPHFAAWSDRACYRLGVGLLVAWLHSPAGQQRWREMCLDATIEEYVTYLPQRDHIEGVYSHGLRRFEDGKSIKAQYYRGELSAAVLGRYGLLGPDRVNAFHDNGIFRVSPGQVPWHIDGTSFWVGYRVDHGAHVGLLLVEPSELPPVELPAAGGAMLRQFARALGAACAQADPVGAMRFARLHGYFTGAEAVPDVLEFMAENEIKMQTNDRVVSIPKPSTMSPEDREAMYRRFSGAGGHEEISFDGTPQQFNEALRQIRQRPMEPTEEVQDDIRRRIMDEYRDELRRMGVFPPGASELPSVPVHGGRQVRAYQWPVIQDEVGHLPESLASIFDNAFVVNPTERGFDIGEGPLDSGGQIVMSHDGKLVMQWNTEQASWVDRFARTAINDVVSGRGRGIEVTRNGQRIGEVGNTIFRDDGTVECELKLDGGGAVLPRDEYVVSFGQEGDE